MAQQHTVIVLNQGEVADALHDYILKHYQEDIDVLTKDVYAVGFRTTVRDTIDQIEIVIEDEEIDDLAEEDASLTVRKRNDETIKTIENMHSSARSSGADVAFEALGGTVRPRAH